MTLGMTRGLSLYLDALRLFAALVVVLSHFAYARVSGGGWEWVRVLNLGSDAVVVFFVLSGLVIAFCAQEKDADLRAFGFSRLTRLWSVALPALLLGFALDRAGAAINPVAYQGWWYAPLPLAETLLRGLSFSSEWGGMQARLGTNGPYWSLSYEAAYYAIFAAAVYLRGLRRGLVVAVLLAVAGVNVALLLPCWLVGVALWHLRARPLGAAVAVLLAVVPLLAYVAFQAAGVAGQLRLLTALILPESWLPGLRFSDEFLWNWLLALLFGAHLRGMMALLRDAPSHASRAAAALRWLAGASFSIYLVHYPVLMFLDAVLPSGALRNAVLMGLTLAVCLAFAAAFERPLSFWRAVARRMLARLAAPRPAPGTA